MQFSECLFDATAVASCCLVGSAFDLEEPIWDTLSDASITPLELATEVAQDLAMEVATFALMASGDSVGSAGVGCVGNFSATDRRGHLGRGGIGVSAAPALAAIGKNR